MRIGIFDPYLTTLSGGEKYILTLASCLAAEHNVELFWDLNTEEKVRADIKQKFSLDLSRVGFTANIFSNSTSTLNRLRASSKYDYLIFLSDGSIPFVMCNLIIHFQTPVEWVIVNKLKNYLKLLRAKAIICNSNYTKHYIDRKFKVNSRVIYPPITLNEKSQPARKDNIILNVGRFGISEAGSSYKKQDILIDVFAKMVRNGLKNWKLVLILSGSGEELSGVTLLREKARNLPVEFVTNTRGDKLQDYYRRARIYWHAAGFNENLIKYPDRAEHFGMATVEAMSSGAVPVVINAGGQREIVEDNISGMFWNTLEELENKTTGLINDQKRWMAFSTQAETRAKFFSKEKFCKEIQSLIK